MNIRLNIISILSLLGLVVVSSAVAQNKSGDGASREVVAVVVDAEGNPLRNAQVTTNEGITSTYTDESGAFKISAKSGYAIVIESEGFETYISDPATNGAQVKYILDKAPIYAGESDVVKLPHGIEEARRYSVSAVSATTGEDMAAYSDLMTSNTLSGQLSGLTAILTNGGINAQNSTLGIRGLHSTSGNDILVLVDGIPRGIDTLLPDEIETIEVLKDATAKILYGSLATNGVVLITTKAGAKHKRTIKVNVDMGVNVISDLPEYLNSYDYATLYNQASINDGLSAHYSAADLAGYAASTGENDFRYPSVDYYDYFLQSASPWKRATLEFAGGNNNTQYALVAGFTDKDGIYKVGIDQGVTQYNVRGNLKMKVNNFIVAKVGMGAIMQNKRSSNLDDASTFSNLSTLRPNEYPLIIASNIIATESNGYPALGASLNTDDNLYGDITYGGNTKTVTITGQLNVGLDFNLNKIVKGLTARGSMGFDNYFQGKESLTTNAPTYAQLWMSDANGNDELTLLQRKTSTVTDQQKLSSTYTYRTTAWLGGFDYLRTFSDDHRLSANALTYYYIGQSTGTTQDTKVLNYALRANYAFKDRYIVEASGAIMGSNHFEGDNRYLPTFAVGAAWILSDETFLKESETIDFLKLKASGGLLGYDGSTSYFLYENTWSASTVRINSTLAPTLTTSTTVGNEDLKWEKSLEYNIGLEGLLLDRRLSFDFNYFNEYRYDIIVSMSSEYSDVYGTLVAQDNWGEVRNSGFDLGLTWRATAGDLTYSVGTNMLFAKNKLLQTNEVTYDDAYLNSVGYSTDALFGYEALGIFGRDVELAGAPTQTLGEYGVGDIAYNDLNGDGIIDTNDKRYLGNSEPRFNFGLEVNLNYKGFGLYVLGTAQIGAYKYLNNNYYWMDGEDKYSAVAWECYDPVTNPDGIYPMLTTQSANNNHQNSSFWLQNSSFFRLKNVEFSYTFGQERPICQWLKSAKIYVRANNLLTISGIKEMDPEVLNAGISNYPILSTVTGGVNLTF
ncbi:MAG: SusC/RagA family TonB-linked outer membrane protein [Rikenellaceae bacterium]